MATNVQKNFMLVFMLLNLAILVIAQGTQFITGPCTSDAACASGCCGFNSGKCAGPIIAQERDGGCGFGNAQPNDNAGQLLSGQASASPSTSAAGPAVSAAGQPTSAAGNPTTLGTAAGQASPTNSGAGNGAGTQFITGPCTSDADCASGCCGFNSGKCAGPIIAQERDGGCGFGNAQPNDNAGQLLSGQASASPSTSAAGPAASAAGQPTSAAENPTTLRTVTGQASPTNSGAGNGAGTQFITGPCTRDADCASGCCGFNSGKCAGPIVAQERDGGCGFGNAQPNKNAARKLQGLP